MKAITLYQPWATLWALGIKKNETRTWNTLHRGPLFIHAGKAVIRVPDDVTRLTKKLAGEYVHNLPRGVIVGAVNLYQSRPITSEDLRFMPKDEIALGDWSNTRFAWLGSNHQIIKPIPCRGRQGLWNIPKELEDRLRRKLEAL